MAKWTKRRMYLDEATGLYRSHTSDRVLTPDQYAARCEQGKRAAQTAKATAAAWREMQPEVDEMVERLKANAGPMIRLPGEPEWMHAHHVAVDRAMRNFKR